jgi:hypothetical protein
MNCGIYTAAVQRLLVCNRTIVIRVRKWDRFPVRVGAIGITYTRRETKMFKRSLYLDHTDLLPLRNMEKNIEIDSPDFF